ncbi:MAG: ABC transporter ATP-binding protein [Candidatus Thorarchaeota archaeon]
MKFLKNKIKNLKDSFISMLKFLRFLRPFKFKLFLLIILLLIGSTVSISSPLIVRFFIDNVILSRNVILLYKATGIFILINIITSVVSFILEYQYGWVSNQIVFNMKKELFDHIIHLPIDFFNDKKIGDIVYRIDNEIQIIQTALTSCVLRIFNNLLMIIGIAGILIWLNYKIFISICLLAPFFFLFSKFFQKKIHLTTKLFREQRARLMEFYFERFEKIFLIKIFNKYNNEQENHNRIVSKSISIDMRNIKLTSLLKNLSVFLFLMAPTIILGYGGYYVIIGVISIGTLVAYIQYIGRLYPPLKDILNLYVELIKATASLNRIWDILEIPREDDIKNQNKLMDFEFNNSIKFDNLTFKYKDKEKEILKGINLCIHKGQKIAFVGLNGSGKSTLAKLICRFHSIENGSIKIDDRNINDINLLNLRKNITLITQENQLLNASILNNIKYGNADITAKRVNEYLKEYNFFDNITGEENRLNLYELNALSLSEGQKQLIAIIRGIERNSSIYIYDESTSNMDTQNEAKIINDLILCKNKKTVILITHNLKLLKNVDRIYVINDGQIIEEGTYESLMYNSKYFMEIFNIKTKELQ